MDQSTPTPPGDTVPNIPPQPIQGHEHENINFNDHKNAQSRDASSRSIDRTRIEDMDENSSMEESAGTTEGSTFSPNHSPDSGACSSQDSNGLNSDQWKTKLNSAKLQWSKLEQEELVACGGNQEQLSTLIQKRYSMNKSEADKQVQEFFSKN